VYSSYLGGSRAGGSPSIGYDTATDLVLDEAGGAYVAGYTLSFDLPTTADAFQPHLGGGVCDYFGGPCGDAFFARISAGGPGVTPAIHLCVNPADAAPGGTIVASWAGNPTPTASDYLRLFALGSAGDDFEDAVIYWPTPNAAAGELSLLLPPDLPVGWYELRLLSPDPDSHLPVPIARSEPIRVDGSATGPPTTTTTSPPTAPCDGATAAVCDDGDPCTVDECVPGRGCVSTPAAGFDAVTCTCGRRDPAACDGQALPASIRAHRERACKLLADAGATTDHHLALKRLGRAARTLKKAIVIASNAHRSRVSADCAGALRDDLRDDTERVERFRTTAR
jgi:hypothetical protein